MSYKSLSILNLNMKLGDTDEINQHVSFKYKLVSHQLAESKRKLDEVCAILKLKNPSLISQINKAAMISHPYHLRMQSVGGGLLNQSQASGRSIKSRAYSTQSKSVK